MLFRSILGAQTFFMLGMALGFSGSLNLSGSFHVLHMLARATFKGLN